MHRVIKPSRLFFKPGPKPNADVVEQANIDDHSDSACLDKNSWAQTVLSLDCVDDFVDLSLTSSSSSLSSTSALSIQKPTLSPSFFGPSVSSSGLSSGNRGNPRNSTDQLDLLESLALTPVRSEFNTLNSPLSAYTFRTATQGFHLAMDLPSTPISWDYSNSPQVPKNVPDEKPIYSDLRLQDLSTVNASEFDDFLAYGTWIQ